MIKVKKGSVKMTGDKDQIFTDVVRVTEAFLKTFAELLDKNETVLLAVLIAASKDKSNAELDIGDLRKILKHMEEEDKHDD